MSRTVGLEGGSKRSRSSLWKAVFVAIRPMNDWVFLAIISRLTKATFQADWRLDMGQKGGTQWGTGALLNEVLSC